MSDEEALQAGFNELIRLGFEAVQNTPLDIHHPILHLWCISHWSLQHSGWTIYERNNPAIGDNPRQLTVQETIWDRGADTNRMYMTESAHDWTSQPTLITRKALLDTAVFDSLFARGQTIHIPVIGVYFPIVYDGTTFGLAIPPFSDYQYSQGIRLVFRGNGPQAWSAVSQWCLDMIKFVKAALENNATSSK